MTTVRRRPAAHGGGLGRGPGTADPLLDASGSPISEAQFLSELVPGRCIGLLPVGQDKWEEKVLLFPASGHMWSFLDTDSCVVTDSVVPAAGGTYGRAFLTSDMGVAPGLARGKFLRFREYPDEADFAQYLSDGREEADAEVVGSGGIAPADPADAINMAGQRVPLSSLLGCRAAFGAPPGLAQPKAAAAPAPAAPAVVGGVLPGLPAAAAAVPVVKTAGLRLRAGAAEPVVDPDNWVLIESTAAGARGDPRRPGPSGIVRGDVALDETTDGWVVIRKLGDLSKDVFLSAECSDHRLIEVSFDRRGCRQQLTWREAVARFQQGTLEGWPIPGPRTVMWCARFIDRRQGGPLDHFRFFTSTMRLSKEAWGVSQYEDIMRMVFYLACWDGANLPNLAGVEVALRRAQLIEYVYRMEEEKTEKADGDGDKKGRGRGRGRGLLHHAFIDESAIFTGTSREFGDAMVCPELLTHVGSEIERDANVLKQVRKAREERRALQP